MSVYASPTAPGTFTSDVAVLSTGDVRIPVHREVSMVARRQDQPYRFAAGSKDVCEAIAQYTGGSVDAGQVMVGPGARVALQLMLASVLTDRREVLIPTPCWASYPTLLRSAGAIPIAVPGRVGQAVDLAALKAANSSTTGAVIINSPRNPDGAVVSDSELKAIVEWTGECGLLLVFDQVYRGVPVGELAASPVDYPELPDHCIVVDGLSKSHALAGLRLGWAIASPQRRAKAAKLASHLIGGTSSAAEDITCAILADDGATQQELRPVLNANLDKAVQELSALPGASVTKPQGGIFVFPYIDRPNVAEWLHDEHRVSVVDGSVFGAPGYVRLSFALEPDRLGEGLDRLWRALGGDHD